ncbi:metal ABC transporter substrate-binding protein [Marinobacter sp. M1N3S26]|uniref:metal ABC transporter substrate-binding protein n=1 Tax=Marinobacter sp. M1N3S26 TaxID=3382299 RepID=UPI00387ABAAE
MASKGWLAGLVLALVAPAAQASLNVFACEPEWGDLARSLMPDADVTVATTAWQDPHYVEARPSLIAAVRRADLVVCTGASLEVGWLPTLLQKSANRQVQEGGPGLFYAAEQVPLHQSHDHVDRSMGDVHPEGDPHVHLNPDAVPVIAEALASRMGQLAPDSTSDIQRRYLSWRVDWNLHRDRWRQAARQLGGLEIVVQHTSFDYLLRWLGVEPVIDLEPKPGLPPSASHLSGVLGHDRLEQADGILVATYQDDRPARWLSEQTGLPVLVLPSTVTDEAPTKTLPDLIDHLIGQLEGLADDA